MYCQYYPYWQYTDHFIFRFVSLLCLRSTLRLYILFVAVCILHPLTELFFACMLWIAHWHIIYTPGYLLKGQTAVHTWDWMSPLFLKDRDVEQYQCLPENQKYCTRSNNSNIVPSSLNAFEDWHKNIIKSHFFPTSL